MTAPEATAGDGRHAAATAWVRDDTTMAEVEAFGAGWEAATSVTAGDGLREAIYHAVRGSLVDWDDAPPPTERKAASRIVDAVLALPALRDVLAAAARDAELRVRVERLASSLRTLGEVLHDVPVAQTYAETAADLRQILDGTP